MTIKLHLLAFGHLNYQFRPTKFLFKLSFIVTEWFCIHSNVQVLVFVDLTEETFPCFSFFDVNPGTLIFLAGTQRLNFSNSKP